MFSVISSKITLEYCNIIFSLRMRSFTKFSSANMSFATNLPNFPAAKFPPYGIMNSILHFFGGSLLSEKNLLHLLHETDDNDANQAMAV